MCFCPQQMGELLFINMVKIKSIRYEEDEQVFVLGYLSTEMPFEHPRGLLSNAIVYIH